MLKSSFLIPIPFTFHSLWSPPKEATEPLQRFHLTVGFQFQKQNSPGIFFKEAHPEGGAPFQFLPSPTLHPHSEKLRAVLETATFANESEVTEAS